MGAKLSNFFGPGFHFSCDTCALLFFVVMIVMSSHDGVHRYFSMFATTCLNKATFETAWWIPGLVAGEQWVVGVLMIVFRKFFPWFFRLLWMGFSPFNWNKQTVSFFVGKTWAMTTSVVKNHSTATSYTLGQSNATFAGQKIQTTCVDALVFRRPLGKRMFLQSWFCQRVSCRQPGLKELNPNGVYHLRLCQAGQLGLLRTFRT